MGRFNSKFSVIIPTLQRSDILPQVVNLCDSHPLVGEVIIINNEQKSLDFDSPTVRVVNLEQNIFVNPAWNMGVSLARHELIALVNDDVLFEPVAFDVAQKALTKGFFGIVGPDRLAFTTAPGAPRVRPPRFSPTTYGFGTFMCMKKENYYDIPGALKIWGGDDLLIQYQKMPPGVIVGVKFETDMGTTSESAEFSTMKQAEFAERDRLLAALDGKRWWHRPLDWYNALRPVKDKLVHKIHAFRM